MWRLWSQLSNCLLRICSLYWMKWPPYTKVLNFPHNAWYYHSLKSLGPQFRPIKTFHLPNTIFCLIPIARQGDPSVDNLVELLDHNHLEDKSYFESGEKALREVRTGMEQVFESEELAVLMDKESQQLFMHVSTSSSPNPPPSDILFSHSCPGPRLCFKFLISRVYVYCK